MSKAKKKKKSDQEEKNPKLYIAVRVRGAPGMRRKILHTLKMLRMHKVNHAILILGNKTNMGMLRKCSGYVTYGVIDEDTLISVLSKRGRIIGNNPLTDKTVKNLTDYDNIKEFAQALMKGEIRFTNKNLNKIKPVFRLHPPRGGFKGSIKRHYAAGGVLGNMGTDINDLIERMI